MTEDEAAKKIGKLETTVLKLINANKVMAKKNAILANNGKRMDNQIRALDKRLRTAEEKLGSRG